MLRFAIAILFFPVSVSLSSLSVADGLARPDEVTINVIDHDDPAEVSELSEVDQPVVRKVSYRTTDNDRPERSDIDRPEPERIVRQEPVERPRPEIVARRPEPEPAERPMRCIRNSR